MHTPFIRTVRSCMMHKFVFKILVETHYETELLGSEYSGYMANFNYLG